MNRSKNWLGFVSRLWRSTAISLVLGGVTTVTIAWGLAALQTTEQGIEPLWVRFDDGFYAAGWERTWGTETFSWRDHSAVWSDGVFVDVLAPPSWSITRDRQAALAIQEAAFREAGRRDTEARVSELASGWPATAMVARVYFVWPENGPPSPERCQGGIILDWKERDELAFAHVLPFVPIWPGFLVDTALFAGFWSVWVFWSPMIRRTWRRAKFKCARCGYPRTGLDANDDCPECGLPCVTPAKHPTSFPLVGGTGSPKHHATE